MRRTSRKARVRITLRRVGLRWARMSVSSRTSPSGETLAQRPSASSSSPGSRMPLIRGEAEAADGSIPWGRAIRAWEGKPTRLSQSSMSSEGRNQPLIEIRARVGQMLLDHQSGTTVDEGEPFAACCQPGEGGMGAEAALTGQPQIQPGVVHAGFRLAPTGFPPIGGTRPLTAEGAEPIRIESTGHHHGEVQSAAERPGQDPLLAMAGGQSHLSACIGWQTIEEEGARSRRRRAQAAGSEFDHRVLSPGLGILRSTITHRSKRVISVPGLRPTPPASGLGVPTVFFCTPCFPTITPLRRNLAPRQSSTCTKPCPISPSVTDEGMDDVDAHRPARSLPPRPFAIPCPSPCPPDRCA